MSGKYKIVVNVYFSTMLSSGTAKDGLLHRHEHVSTSLGEKKSYQFNTSKQRHIGIYHAYHIADVQKLTHSQIQTIYQINKTDLKQKNQKQTFHSILLDMISISPRIKLFRRQYTI